MNVSYLLACDFNRVFEAECAAYPDAIRLYAEGRIRVTGGRLTTDNGDHPTA